VVWLLVFLSIISIAIMVERVIFFTRLARIDVDSIARKLRQLLDAGDYEGARRYLESQPGIEARIVLSGLRELKNGTASVEEAMIGTKVSEKFSLERYLTFLGTVGNNAPFLGLFGTVTGIIKAFHSLAVTATPNLKTLMFGVAEALVTTAIGLIVAIPAVLANNSFRRQVTAVITRSEAMSRVLLAHIKADPDFRIPERVAQEPTAVRAKDVPESEPPRASGKGKNKKERVG